MFRKLRNKLIWINFGITSVVIIIVFSAIYLFSTRAALDRPPAPNRISINGSSEEVNNDFENLITITLKEEKRASANQLLYTLIAFGILIEIIVVIISYFLAEEAIKPVREAYETQKVFIANASHEIKTPLAAISTNLEAADLGDNKWIKNVEIETAKLTNLNTKLLTLARTDLITKTSTAEINLNSAVKETLKSFEPRLNHKILETQINLPKTLKINSADFLEILTILMDNAIKYSEAKITLTLSEHTLIIKNDGKTIAPSALPHLFDRFYQVDKSAEGVGLGLAIAKSLADRNRWSLSVTSMYQETAFKLAF